MRGRPVPASMPAYVLVDLHVHDPAVYESYKAAVTPTIHAHGGKYLVRGGQHTTLDGTWKPNRLVVLEFPSRAAAEGWFNSPEYKKAKAFRLRSATGSLVLVDGL